MLLPARAQAGGARRHAGIDDIALPRDMQHRLAEFAQPPPERRHGTRAHALHDLGEVAQRAAGAAAADVREQVRVGVQACKHRLLVPRLEKCLAIPCAQQHRPARVAGAPLGAVDVALDARGGGDEDQRPHLPRRGERPAQRQPPPHRVADHAAGAHFRLLPHELVLRAGRPRAMPGQHRHTDPQRWTEVRLHVGPVRRLAKKTVQENRGQRLCGVAHRAASSAAAMRARTPRCQRAVAARSQRTSISVGPRRARAAARAPRKAAADAGAA